MIKGLGQQTASVRYNILTSTMDVLFLFLLLPTYGMEGYYFSFLVTHVVNFILSVRRLFKITGKLMNLLTPVLVATATAVSILLAGFVRELILRGVAYVLLLGSLLYLFRVISREDATWLLGLVRKKGQS